MSFINLHNKNPSRRADFFAGDKQKQLLAFTAGFESRSHALARAGETGSRKTFVGTKVYP